MTSPYTFDPTDTFNVLVTHGKALGQFNTVDIGEPTSAPLQGLCLWIFNTNLGNAPTGSGLAVSAGQYTVTCRMTMSALITPKSEIEIKMGRAAASYLARLSAGFTLGGIARNVDLLGEIGAQMTWTFGYGTIDQKLFRIADLPVPMIINDVFPQAE